MKIPRTKSYFLIALLLLSLTQFNGVQFASATTEAVIVEQTKNTLGVTKPAYEHLTVTKQVVTNSCITKQLNSLVHTQLLQTQVPVLQQNLSYDLFAQPAPETLLVGCDQGTTLTVRESFVSVQLAVGTGPVFELVSPKQYHAYVLQTGTVQELKMGLISGSQLNTEPEVKEARLSLSKKLVIEQSVDLSFNKKRLMILRC